MLLWPDTPHDQSRAEPASATHLLPTTRRGVARPVRPSRSFTSTAIVGTNEAAVPSRRATLRLALSAPADNGGGRLDGRSAEADSCLGDAGACSSSGLQPRARRRAQPHSPPRPRPTRRFWAAPLGPFNFWCTPHAPPAPEPTLPTAPYQPKTWPICRDSAEVGDPGLEPGTSSLSEKRSNRLS